MSSKQKIEQGIELIREGLSEVSDKSTNINTLIGVLDILSEDLTMEDFSVKYKNNTFYLEDDMLSYLLRENGLLFLTDLKLETEFGEEKVITIHLNANDLFAWAFSDSEPISKKELPEYFKGIIEKVPHFHDKFICKKRNMRPQLFVRNSIKEDGVWEDWMDKLEPNPDEL